MKKTILILLFLVFNQLTFGQNRELTDEEINNSGPTKIKFIEKSDEVENLFKSDLKKGTLFLLLQSGIVPVIYPNEKNFENKFHVYYYDFGCDGQNLDNVSLYNEYVFRHLTKLYGDKWEKDIRNDVIGLKKWKQK